MKIKLLKKYHQIEAGTIHDVIRIVPHGGNSDSERQYVIKAPGRMSLQNIHILSNDAEVVQEPRGDLKVEGDQEYTLVLYKTNGGRPYYLASEVGLGYHWSEHFRNTFVSASRAEEIQRAPNFTYEKLEQYHSVVIYKRKLEFHSEMTQVDVLDEKIRKENLRASALAKLTDEEKKELGLD